MNRRLRSRLNDAVGALSAALRESRDDRNMSNTIVRLLSEVDRLRQSGSFGRFQPDPDLLSGEAHAERAREDREKRREEQRKARIRVRVSDG